MKRREFIFFMALVMVTLSCGKPKGRAGIKIKLKKGEYLKLYANIIGASFLLGKNSTLDLNGFVIDGDEEGAETKVHQAITMQDESIIKNGTIRGYINSISVVSNLREGYLNKLKNISKNEAEIIGVEYRNLSKGGQQIIDVEILNSVSHAVYVQSFVSNVTIDSCIFDNTGLMHIYLDHGSKGHTIKNNSFFKCGFNHTKGREGIAIDSCINATIKNNLFDGKMKLRAISAYTNKGENNITREICRGHLIKGNIFTGMEKGIKLASRGNYCINTIVENNEFINIPLPIVDNGTNNQIIA